MSTTNNEDSSCIAFMACCWSFQEWLYIARTYIKFSIMRNPYINDPDLSGIFFFIKGHEAYLHFMKCKRKPGFDRFLKFPAIGIKTGGHVNRNHKGARGIYKINGH